MNNYRGRFAPSPSGPLHFGSLVAALGSWLDAKSNQGLWLVRMEDIDPPREVPGAAADILRALERYGLLWDEDVSYQSNNLADYQEIIEQLLAEQKAYRCICSRKQIKLKGAIYQNTCRDKSYDLNQGLNNNLNHGQKNDHSIRLKMTNPLTSFSDCYQGDCLVESQFSSEDFILKRKDGLFAYMLAVVCDDAAQQISHVIRGADLLETTVQQLNLFKILNKKAPIYGHLPLAVNSQGLKLSKQNHAKGISSDHISENLWQALSFLQQSPPNELRHESKDNLLQWAIKSWRPQAFAGKTQITHKDN